MEENQEILHFLASASEKCGEMARKIREDPILLKKLTEEKVDGDKNNRFTRDFKTLADVLIQEYIKTELSFKFPAFRGCVYGEENGKIELESGQCVEICLEKSGDEIEDMLADVMNDNIAAKRLREIICGQISSSKNIDSTPCTSSSADLKMGVWIDPIDGTNVYIDSSLDKQPTDSEGEDIFVSHGLQNVTILIGVFSLETGKALLGIINQPFSCFDPKNDRWYGKCYHNDNIVSSSIPCDTDCLRIVMSKADSMLGKMQQTPTFDVKTASGAGYKILCVINGHKFADIALSTTNSTYFYDVCAPHGILKANEGNILVWKKFLGVIDKFTACGDKKEQKEICDSCEIEYTAKTGHNYCNENGIIAFQDYSALLWFSNCVKNMF